MSAPTGPRRRSVILVWDLDETLILFQSLVQGSYAQAVNAALSARGSTSDDSSTQAQPPSQPAPLQSSLKYVDPAAAHALGERLTVALFDLLDRHLFYDKIEFLDPMHLDEATGQQHAGAGRPEAAGAGQQQVNPEAEQRWPRGAGHPHEQQAGQQSQQPHAPEPGQQGHLCEQLPGQQPQQPHAPEQGHLREMQAGEQLQQQGRGGHPQSLAEPSWEMERSQGVAEPPGGEHGKGQHQQCQQQRGSEGEVAPSAAEPRTRQAHVLPSQLPVAQVLHAPEQGDGTPPSQLAGRSQQGSPDAAGGQGTQESVPPSTAVAEHAQQQQQAGGLGVRAAGTKRSYDAAISPPHEHPEGKRSLLQPQQQQQQQEQEKQSDSHSQRIHHDGDPQLPSNSSQQPQQVRPDATALDAGSHTAKLFMRARALYNAGFDELPLSSPEREGILKARLDLNELTQGWPAHALSLLHNVNMEAEAKGCDVHHCIVTTGQLVATLGKLMLFGLGDSIQGDMVYSASKLPKYTVFQAIQQRFGPSAAYVAVGDGREEMLAAGLLGWPFVQVSLAGSSNAALRSDAKAEHTPPEAACAANGCKGGDGCSKMGSATSTMGADCAAAGSPSEAAADGRLDSCVAEAVLADGCQPQRDHTAGAAAPLSMPLLMQSNSGGLRIDELCPSGLLELALQGSTSGTFT